MLSSIILRRVIDTFLILYSCAGIMLSSTIGINIKEYNLSTVQYSAYLFVTVYPICVGFLRFVWQVYIENENIKKLTRFGISITCITCMFYVVTCIYLFLNEQINFNNTNRTILITNIMYLVIILLIIVLVPMYLYAKVYEKKNIQIKYDNADQYIADQYNLMETQPQKVQQYQDFNEYGYGYIY